MKKLKRLGWCGNVEDKPCFDGVIDTYCVPEMKTIKAVSVYKSKKEAKKRFQSVFEVFVLNA